MGDNTPVSESAMLLIGVRELDAAELQRLESSGIAMLAWEGGRSPGNVQAA